MPPDGAQHPAIEPLATPWADSTADEPTARLPHVPPAAPDLDVPARLRPAHRRAVRRGRLGDRAGLPRVLAGVTGLLLVAAVVQGLIGGAPGGTPVAAAESVPVTVPSWTPSPPPPTTAEAEQQAIAQPAVTDTDEPEPAPVEPEPPAETTQAATTEHEQAHPSTESHSGGEDGHSGSSSGSDHDSSGSGSGSRSGDDSNDGSGDRSGGAESEQSREVTYRSCFEARLAGAAPIRRDEPGYSRRLDRDGDGVACEFRWR